MEITLTEDEYNFFMQFVNAGISEPVVIGHIMENNGARIHVQIEVEGSEEEEEDIESAADELVRNSEVI